MRAFRLLAAASLLLVLVPAVPTAPAFPAICTAGHTLAVDLSTGSRAGSAIGTGQQDTDWQVAHPSLGATLGPTFAVNRLTTWAAPPSYARWINPWDQTPPNNVPGGTPLAGSATPYAFRFDFPLDLVSYRDPRIDIEYAADDSITWALNGNPIGGAPAAAPPGSAKSTLFYAPTGSGFFVSGNNVLVALVANPVGHLGLMVDGFARALCIQPPPPPCVGAATTWSLDVTTGYSYAVPGALATGQDDDEWVVRSTPTNFAYNQPARVIDPHVSWFPASPGARWLNPWPVTGANAAPGGQLAPQGDYVYALDFHLPATALANIVVDLRVAADDGFEVHVNALGQMIASKPPTAYGAKTTVLVGPSSPGHFVAGSNTLLVKVYNDISVTGLLVEGQIRGDCVPLGPCTFDVPLTTGLDLSGNLLPPGAKDPRWTILVPPVAGSPPWDAFAINPEPHWVAPSSGGWISPTAGGNPGTPPLGNYTWATQFSMPCAPSNCGAVALELEFAADEWGELVLNGNPLPSFTDPQSTRTVRLYGCGNFGGVNQLEAFVVNDGFDTGILVSGSLHYP